MAKTPLISIIGVPNTGKSTLFNRLIGKRKALVHSSPGMTRDVYQKTFEIGQKQFKIQDTGGYFEDNDIITDAINQRIFREAKRSDLIIFLFDGRREILGYEKDLFLEIKKTNSRLLAVVNKADNLERFLLPNSYYSLKENFIFISAEHNEGVEVLLEQIEECFRDYSGSENNEAEVPQARISIMGKPNVGKSSIINKILNDNFVIVSPLAGTTRDSVDLEIKRYNKTYILVDNAGIRKLKKVKESTESAAVIRAEKDIQDADIIVFVIDVSQRIDQNDLLIAHKLLKAAKPVIIAANKWDLVEDKGNAQQVINKIRDSFNFFYFAPLILVSANTGKNVFALLEKAEIIHQLLNTKIKTARVNTVVQGILQEQKFLTENNRQFNPKYISIESYRPFFVNFSTSSKSKLKPFHERHLKKRIVEEFGLEGIPVFIKITPKERKT